MSAKWATNAATRTMHTKRSDADLATAAILLWEAMPAGSRREFVFQQGEKTLGYLSVDKPTGVHPIVVNVSRGDKAIVVPVGGIEACGEAVSGSPAEPARDGQTSPASSEGA